MVTDFDSAKHPADNGRGDIRQVWSPRPSAQATRVARYRTGPHLLEGQNELSSFLFRRMLSAVVLPVAQHTTVDVLTRGSRILERVRESGSSKCRLSKASKKAVRPMSSGKRWQKPQHFQLTDVTSQAVQKRLQSTIALVHVYHFDDSYPGELRLIGHWFLYAASCSSVRSLQRLATS